MIIRSHISTPMRSFRLGDTTSDRGLSLVPTYCGSQVVYKVKVLARENVGIGFKSLRVSDSFALRSATLTSRSLRKNLSPTNTRPFQSEMVYTHN